MHNGILISICIPTYNRSKYLLRCVESIIGYPFNDIEIIILDNYSTDNTKEVLNAYSDDRIKYFCNDSNIGARQNIRNIIDLATGQYCFYLTDDDMLLPGALHSVKEYIKKYNPDVFISDMIVYLEKSNSSSISSALSTTKCPDEISIEEKAKIFFRSHILSSLCFNKSKVDFAFYDSHVDLWYPSMLLMGLLSNRIGYLAGPVVIHIWENELFWGDDSSENHLYNSFLEGIFVFKGKLDDNFFKEICKISIYNDKKLDARYLSVFGRNEFRNIQFNLWYAKTKLILKRSIKNLIKYT